jgi:DNA-binding NarL/FixJ family response regulator
MKEVIRILLADDHAVVREGLRALLDQHDDFEVVGEAEDGDAALREADRLHPTLVLMDIKMPGPGPVETIRRLKQSVTAVQVLVFTSYVEDCQVRDALEAGALGYLLKDALREDLVRAVRAVASGQPWLHPQAQRQLVEGMRRPPSRAEALTVRERSVLAQLAEGRSNKQIARNLKLTEGTVKGYVSQVLDKLGVADRTQAALLAHKEGLMR